MAARQLRLERLDTPLGPTLVVTDAEEVLHAVDWSDDPAHLETRLAQRLGTPVHLTSPKAPSKARRALEAYFAGDLDALDPVRTETGGTAFQRRVWSALRAISAGRTASYGALAAAIGQPGAMRAVGLANGANPIPVVIPCHRVIAANASLGGFGGGLERKRWLLGHEGVSPATYGEAQGELLL